MSVPYYRQETPNWCWAASSLMLLHALNQMQFNSQLALAQAWLGPNCNIMLPFGDITQHLVQTLPGRLIRNVRRNITEHQLLQSLSFAPVMIGFQSGGSGHIMLIARANGDNPPTMRVHDPGSIDHGISNFSFLRLQQHERSWTHTWIVR